MKLKQKEKELLWNFWFAGLVDGDGYFYRNKNNEISFELTTHIIDISVLSTIKNKLQGGSIKPRSGSNSVRYRVKKKVIVIDIINRLNGKLHHPTRLKQFQCCCDIYQIVPLPSPNKIAWDNPYLVGLLDADGSISISILKKLCNLQKSGLNDKICRLEQSGNFNQMSIKITSVSKQLIDFIQQSYGFGAIYIEKANRNNKSPKPKYHWTLKGQKDFDTLRAILKKRPFKSVKRHRMRLISKYFYYKKLRYPSKPKTSIEYKTWVKFCKCWFKYSW